MTDANVNRRLVVPADAVRLTSDALRSMRNMESCCFWFGTRPENGLEMVEGIVIPQQNNNRGHYHVTVDAMIKVGNVARERGWKNLAQVHSHPGKGVGHSGYDDEMANSRRALSLVFPNYGVLPGAWRFRGWLWRILTKPFPTEIGVHRYAGGRWRFLEPSEIAGCVDIVAGPRPTLIDLRR